MRTLLTQVPIPSATGASDTAQLIERFRDFAHCNRSKPITAREAVAAYCLLGELEGLRALLNAIRDVARAGEAQLPDRALALINAACAGVDGGETAH